MPYLLLIVDVLHYQEKMIKETMFSQKEKEFKFKTPKVSLNKKISQ